MRSFEVVVAGPRSEGEVAWLGVGPVSGVGPLTWSSLDKAFGFAVGLWRVGPSAAVLEAHLKTNVAKLVEAIAAAVIGEQGAHGDAMAGEKINGFLEKGDGGIGFLIRKDLGEGQAGVVVDGDMQSFPPRVFVLTAAPAVAVDAAQYKLLSIDGGKSRFCRHALLTHTRSLQTLANSAMTL